MIGTAKMTKASRCGLIVGAAGALMLATTGVSFAQDNKASEVSKVERKNLAPVSKEVLRVKLPRPTVVKLPNGMTLLLIEDHKLPTISFSMMIRPGQLADPDGLPGLASMTAGMLREGTEKRTSAQLATEVDSLGASLGA